MDIGNWLANAGTHISDWAKYGIMLIGIVLIIVAAAKIAMGFISHGKGQTNWLLCIAMLLVGGFFFGSQFAGLQKLADVGTKTIGDLGTGNTGSADSGGGAGTTTP